MSRSQLSAQARVGGGGAVVVRDRHVGHRIEEALLVVRGSNEPQG